MMTGGTPFYPYFRKTREHSFTSSQILVAYFGRYFDSKWIVSMCEVVAALGLRFVRLHEDVLECDLSVLKSINCLFEFPLRG